MRTAGMRKRLDELDELGEAVARLVEEQARKTSALARVGELVKLARQLLTVSPHQLLHGLGEWLRKQGVDLGVGQQLLGHSWGARMMRPWPVAGFYISSVKPSSFKPSSNADIARL
jgi:hypothetical protein